MVSVPSHTQTVKVHHVQVRRIACEACREPFAYVAGELLRVHSTGLLGITSPGRLFDNAVDSATEKLRRLGRTPHGAARCPHCRTYQGWMVARRLFKALRWGLLLGAFAGAIAGIVAYGQVTAWNRRGILESILVLGGIGALVGPLLFASVAWTTFLVRGDARRSMDDRELRTLLDACVRDGLDPPSHWWFDRLEKREPKADWLVSLGVADDVGRFDLPAEDRTESWIDELRLDAP